MKTFYILTGFFLCTIPALAQPSPEETARMLQSQSEQYTFASTVSHAWGMHLNPASIGKMYPMNAMYNVYESKGKLLEHEILFQNYLFNFGWRRALSSSMQYRFDQFSVAMGFGTPELLAGGNFEWFSTDLPGKSRGSVWNFGILMEADPHVVISLTKRNINQPVFGGVKLQGLQSAGVAVRPYARSDRLMIALEYTISNEQRLKDGLIKIGVDGAVLRNLRAYALINRVPVGGGTTVMVGLRFYVNYAAFGLGSAFEKFKKYTGSVGSVLFSPEPRGLQ